MNKFSQRDALLATIPGAVSEDMNTWEKITPPKSTAPSFELSADGTTTIGDALEATNDSDFLYRTPFGIVPGYQLPFLRMACEKEAKRNIIKRYGNSKYVPHQGTKEMARRVAKSLTSA
jgi:hypothetical protein